MKKNRKTTRRMNVVNRSVMHFGGVAALVFVMLMLNVLTESRNDHISERIGKATKELERLEDVRTRESCRWEEMKAPGRLESALLRHGLSMKPARAEQNVYMKADGSPYPGQLSVARARQRAAGTVVLSRQSRR